MDLFFPKSLLCAPPTCCSTTCYPCWTFLTIATKAPGPTPSSVLKKSLQLALFLAMSSAGTATKHLAVTEVKLGVSKTLPTSTSAVCGRKQQSKQTKSMRTSNQKGARDSQRVCQITWLPMAISVPFPVINSLWQEHSDSNPTVAPKIEKLI